jgi:hypothetical protein
MVMGSGWCQLAGPDGQDGVQFGDRQDPSGAPRRPVKDESCTRGAELVIGAEQHPQADRAQEVQSGEIHDDLGAAIPAELVKNPLQLGCAD